MMKEVSEGTAVGASPCGLRAMESSVFGAAVTRELFAAILERIRRFGVPPPLVQRR